MTCVEALEGRRLLTVGVATFEGDVVFGPTSRLEIELGGTEPGTQYDVVNVQARVTLGGTLQVVLLGGFVPHAGDSFRVLNFGSRSGDFSGYAGLNLPNGLQLRPVFDDAALTLTALPPAQVMGRHVFYNGSRFDGHDPAAGIADDAAVAPDKQALLPGQAASFANVTGYNRGINGVMVDVLNLGGVASAEDFLLRAGDGTAAGWAAAPAPASVSVRGGAGTNGSDRVTITWPDGAVRNRWLEVTVRPTLRNGLGAADVFSFGNLVGETGDGGAPLRVDAADVVATRAALPAAGVEIDSPFDHDRDGRVNARDLAAVRANFGRSLAPPPVAVPSSMRSGVTRDRPTSRPPWDATLLGDAALLRDAR